MFNDRRKLSKLADPRLHGHYPLRGLYQALAVASMCIQEEAATRPLIADVVTALTYLASQTYEPTSHHHSEERRSGRWWTDQKLEREDHGNGFKWDAYALESDDSPREIANILKKGFDRDRAVSEAMIWGSSWREKQRAAAQASLDALNLNE